MTTSELHLNGGDALSRTSVQAWIVGLLSLHVLAWTLFADITHGGLHHDILESWAWGKEFAFGYPKHPPAYAWAAGLWFSIFPRSNWAFYLLAEVNGALGLLGGWAVAGRLLQGRERLAALALLALTPFYSLHAWKYNANTALLALWPWTAYALIRSLETRFVVHGVLFGALAALSVLTKYYSALLLASCLVAAVLHPHARSYFRSAAPYVAVLVGTVIIAPHVWWMIAHDYQTIDYAVATTKHPTLDILLRGASAILQAVMLHALAIVCYLWMLKPEERRSLPARLRDGLRRPDTWWMAALAFGPFVLTFVALIFGHVRISGQFMIPIFFMVPTAVLYLADERIDAVRLRLLARSAVAFPIAALVAAPFIAFATFKGNADTWTLPRRAVSIEANRIWRETFGTRLDVVAGDDRYAQALTFYAPDAPSLLIDFDKRLAPWITDERLARSGMMVICRKEDAVCPEAAKAVLAPGVQIREVTQTSTLLGMKSRPHTVVLYLMAPAKS